MFKIALCFVLLSVAVFAAVEEYTLETCKCGEGYQPEADNNGKVQCGGILLAHAKPCNIPQAPKCVCTEKVTAILSDIEGTWCTFSENGENKKKWACENGDEWTAYKKELEEYEKKRFE